MGIYRNGISMRLRPNSRASTEHAPGPSIASAAATAPGVMCIHKSAGCVNARNNSTNAITAPATGVHTPIANKPAEHATTDCSEASAGRGPVINIAMVC